MKVLGILFEGIAALALFFLLGCGLTAAALHFELPHLMGPAAAAALWGGVGLSSLHVVRRATRP